MGIAVSLSALSSEIKALTKLSGIIFALQQLEEELERPDVGPMAICTDPRPSKSRQIRGAIASI
jgi:hypothetical protein